MKRSDLIPSEQKSVLWSERNILSLCSCYYKVTIMYTMNLYQLYSIMPKSYLRIKIVYKIDYFSANESGFTNRITNCIVGHFI